MTCSFIFFYLFFYSGDERYISVSFDIFGIILSDGQVTFSLVHVNLFVPKPHLTKKEPRRRQTRESTVSFAILSQNFLTVVNREIFQISPATLNKAINKAKAKTNNYNRNWGEGGAFLLFFLPLPLD